MSKIVQCSRKFVWIKAPNDNVKAGDILTCPQNCPFKGTFCIKLSSFSVKRVNEVDDNSIENSTSIIKYNETENKTVPVNQLQQTEESNSSVSSKDVIKEFPVFAKNENNQDNIGENNKNKSYFDQLNSSLSRRRNDSSEMKQEDDSIFIVKDQYNAFYVGRDLVFSDNRDIILKNPDCRTLDEALQFLFEHWETKYVFENNDGTELREDFLWLLYQTIYKNSKIKKYEVDKIIKSQDLSLSEKFFYLFYDVVFRYDPPNGFYFYNGKSSIYPLTYWFRDKNDFIDRYVDDGPSAIQFRKNFQLEKNLVLHYLGYTSIDENEDKFYDDIVLFCANKNKKIIYLDKNRYYEPIQLGTIENFIKNMQRPTSIEYLESMVSFLHRFEITKMGVSIRSADNAFVESRRDNLIEDDCIYQSIGMAGSELATEYDLFVSVLKEFCRVFNPEIVSINGVNFTKKDYSGEIKHIIFNYMKYFCGEVSDSNVDFQNARSLAWLVKSLYERKIFSRFYCENDQEIERIIALVTEKENVHRKYFSLAQTPVVCIGTKEMLVIDYIRNMLTEDLVAVSKIFDSQNGNPIIKAFFEVKLKNFDDSFIRCKSKEYQAQYDDFIKTE